MVAVASSGIHFTNPREFLPYCYIATSVNILDVTPTNSDFTATAAFTEMAKRGIQDQTNWTANTYKTLLSISSGCGLVAAVIGCTAGGVEATTFEFTVDGVLTTILVTGLASGERACLLPHGVNSVLYTTAGDVDTPGAEAEDADHATFGGGRVSSYILPWRSLGGIPLLKFNASLLIRAKHSANITNATATAYSGVMYRQFLTA